jgi:hypothetical protein
MNVLDDPTYLLYLYVKSIRGITDLGITDLGITDLGITDLGITEYEVCTQREDRLG